MPGTTPTYPNPSIPIPNDFPPQHQDAQPGFTEQMRPKPMTDNPQYCAAGKLMNRAAIVTGGDSGIGQAVAIAFAKEGADVAIAFLQETNDAYETKSAVEAYGRRCILLPCDLKNHTAANAVVGETMRAFGHIDILVNNIAVHYPKNSIEEITPEQLGITFSTNVLSYFHMVKAAMPHLHAGASIINTTSVAAYKGKETLIDYSATKGAVVSFTRSLALSLAPKGIRVNSVAPGPVWTPLIPSSFSPQEVEQFGKDTPLGRAAQPFELAPTYVYLASDDSGYVTGQVLHVNGGTITES
ncbi:MAG: SDR family oxidoreductase [Bacillota bacterium]